MVSLEWDLRPPLLSVGCSFYTLGHGGMAEGLPQKYGGVELPWLLLLLIDVLPGMSTVDDIKAYYPCMRAQ
jgi:hypothetical protein